MKAKCPKGVRLECADRNYTISILNIRTLEGVGFRFLYKEDSFFFFFTFCLGYRTPSGKGSTLKGMNAPKASK